MMNRSLCCSKQTDLSIAAVITNLNIPTGRTKSVSVDTTHSALIWLKNTLTPSALVAVADSTLSS